MHRRFHRGGTNGGRGQGRHAGSGGRHNVNNRSSTDTAFSPFLSGVIDGNTRISNEAGALQFLQEIAKYPDAMEVLGKLTNKAKAGKDALLRAINIACIDAKSMNDGVIPFLEILGADVCSVGAAKFMSDDLFVAIFQIAGFIDVLQKHVKDGTIEEASVDVVAYFLIAVSRALPSARDLPAVHEIAEKLSESSCEATVALATILLPAKLTLEAEQHLMDDDVPSKSINPSAIESIEHLRAYKPMHDNDFPIDYRKIAIVPTAGELNAPIGASCIESAIVFNGEHGSSRASAMLDRQFRLLREDMIAPMKEELAKELKQKKEGRNKTFSNPRAVGVELKPRPCVLIQVDMPSRLAHRLNSKKGDNFLEGAGKRILAKDSCVLFVNLDGTVQFVGEIVRREANEMMCRKSHLIVGISLLNGSLLDILMQLRKFDINAEDKPGRYTPNPPVITPLLFQASSSLFSYKPVLERLKDMVTIPFGPQLAHRLPPIVSPTATSISPEMQAVLSSDPSQHESVLRALNSNVSLVHGPPGCGKSFVGVSIAKEILSDKHFAFLDDGAKPPAPAQPSFLFDDDVGFSIGHDPALATVKKCQREKILAICYTNHALDDFLESLVDNGVPLGSIVRLGNSPKISERMKPRCVNDMDEASFSRVQSAQYFQIKNQLKESEDALGEYSINVEYYMWGINSWSYVKDFLTSRRHDAAMSDALSALRHDEPTIPGMQVVGKKGKKSTGDKYWQLWLSGKPHPTLAKDTLSEDSVWRKTKEERVQLLNKWHDLHRRESLSQLEMQLQRHSCLLDELAALRGESKVAPLKAARIIGCTTTSAAKYASILSTVSVTTVIVEEAAEILEAHILTALCPSVKRLVMIGDHLQLRAKLEHYPLRKESGKQINFDESLFERLVFQSTFPVSMLTVQHRMRPEISAIVRETTYPELKDHESTLKRDHILGLAADMVFITHEQPESADTDAELSGSSSKTNAHEADMAVAVAQYLLRQGYVSTDLVILTAYLGQLVAVRERLSGLDIGTEISDQDKGELSKNDLKISDGDLKAMKAEVEPKLAGGGGAKLALASAKTSIRVATIDNFQGEEAKIIIASLVRSNKQGDIGFLSGPERVNVLFSRARDGFIIIGNSDCFENARSEKGRMLWCGILEKLRSMGAIQEGLPAMCQTHKIPNNLKTPGAFAKLCLDGGCDKPCGTPLPTCPEGHLCPRLCHPATIRGENSHASMSCQVAMPAKCPQGHDVKKICSREDPERCLAKVRDDCPKGHFCERFCCVPSENKDPCGECRRLETERRRREEQLNKEAQQRSKELAAAQFQLEEDERQRRAQLEDFQHKARLARMQNEKSLMKIEASRLEKEHSMLLNLLNAPSGPDDSSDGTLTPGQASSDDEGGDDSGETDPMGEVDGTVPGSKPDDDKDTWKWADGSSRADMDTDDGEVVSLKRPSANSVPAFRSTRGNKKKKAKAETEAETEPPSGPPLYTRDEILKMLKPFFLAAEKDDWPRVYELACAKSEPAKGDKVGLSSPVAVLLRLAKLKLGDPLEELQQDLVGIRARSTNLLAKPSLHDAAEVNALTAAIIDYVSMAVEAADGRLPATTSGFARAYLARDVVQQNLLPTSWKVEAEARREVKMSADPQQRSATASSAAADWVREKEKGGKVNLGSVDELMGMIGLETVKRSILSEMHAINMTREQGQAHGLSSYNSRYDGNPGTGKTTVARLYSQFLCEMGVLPVGAVTEETSGSGLITEGVSGLKSILDRVKAAGGGVIFVDESYQLSPSDSQSGRQVLDFILAHAESFQDKDYGPLVWIFAGYEEKMDKLFEHNPGLPSRFPTRIVFDDYSFDELKEIFEGLMLNMPPSPKKSALPAVPAPQKPTIMQLGGSGVSNRLQGFYRQGLYSARPNETDEWGNIWQWDNNKSTFKDNFNNITGYGKANLGTSSNPIISCIDNSMWTFDRKTKMWQNDAGKVQKGYPGKPLPPAPVSTGPARPYLISQDKWLRIAIRRLSKRRNTVGFGNARAVRILFDQTKKRQSTRIIDQRNKGHNPYIMELTRDDLLGPRADQTAVESSKAWSDLLAMEGLGEVKEEVQKLLQLVVLNAELEEAEKEQRNIALNRIFLGNPGTGKTSVAKLYGQILADLGLLSKGEIHLKNPSDFVGSTLGSSEQQTRAILSAAEGCVLVIDEAYSLNPSMGGSAGGGIGGGSSFDPYKASVIDTIVEQVQNVPGEDRAVLLLGYRKPMEAFLAIANPGLARRFQLESAFEFSDFDDSALVRILRKRCVEQQLDIDLATANFAVKKLSKARALPNFGNAGSVNNLLSRAVLALGQRTVMCDIKAKSTLRQEDFAGLDVPCSEDDLFRGIIGCDSVVKKLQELKATIRLCQAQGKSPTDKVEYNYVFCGPPGTGKTTVAARMGKMFHMLGLLPTDEVVETSASQLQTGFVGQAGRKTYEWLEKARGKVLFCDEAYQLSPQNGGSFMHEVVDELVKQLTSPEFKDKLVVILAGYESDMDKMLDANQGLRSRFSEKLMFTEFSPELVTQLLCKTLADDCMELSSGAKDALPGLVLRLVQSRSFANGRDVMTWSKRIFRFYAQRKAAYPESSDEIIATDLSQSLDEFLHSKGVPAASSGAWDSAFHSTKYGSGPSASNFQSDQSFARPPPPPQAASKLSIVDVTEAPPLIQGASHPGDASGAFLLELQSTLDLNGLNTAEDVARLALMGMGEDQMSTLVQELAQRTGTTLDAAKDKLIEWQKLQLNVQDQMRAQEKEVEAAKAERRKAMVPIWRCGVCGRADKPYIACYVAPFIVRYEEIEVSK